MTGPLGDLGQGQADRAEPFGQAGVGIVHRNDSGISRADTLLLMKFAIAIPQFYADGEFDPAAFRAYLARAEELGFDSAWTQEGHARRRAAAQPDRGDDLRGRVHRADAARAASVFVSTLHSPVHLAKSLATLDQLSRGRIEVGVGTGGRGRPFAAFGVDPARYVARFTEGVRLMKALWTEPRVTFDGEFWQLENAAMEPKPFQKPYPPLWFGGASEPALRRAVRLGDGFFGAGSSPTAKFAEQVRIVRAALDEAGRPAADFPIAKRVYIAIDDDAERAGNRMNAALEGIYGQPGAGHRGRRDRRHGRRLRPRGERGGRGRGGAHPVHGAVRPARADGAAGRRSCYWLPNLPDRPGHREGHRADHQDQREAVRVLIGIAADRGHGDPADDDADRDAPPERAPAFLAGRHLLDGAPPAGRGGHPGLHPGGYLLLDPVQEGRHHRVAVLGPQFLVSRRGSTDLGDHLTAGGRVRLARARHPLAGRCLDLVV